MGKNKLIKTLQKLSLEERAGFVRFVQSPYFNTSKELIRLSELIASQTAESSDADFLKKMYPRAQQSPRKLTDLVYQLTNLLEEYLSIEKYRANPFQQKINLMSLVYEKDLEPLANGIEKDLEQLHAQSPLRDSNFFYESFMVHAERDFSFRLSGKISDDESLQIKSDQLDLFYLAQKLKDACEMLNRSRIVATRYDLKMLEAVIPYLRQHPELHAGHVAIQVYLNMYLMLTENDSAPYFFRLKELADQNPDAFVNDELLSIYGYAQNYCIRRLNAGEADFLYHLFGIYKHSFETGLVLTNNKNIEWDFKNFVSLGLRIKDFDWTYHIIDVFRGQLPVAVRQNAYTYNLANYYYETGDYKRATKLLNSVEFTEIYYNLDAKSMLLKIYYKVEEEESFYSLVSSFGIYLRRNKLISNENVEVYSNLIRFTKKAFVLKTMLPYERKKDFMKKVDQLKQSISGTQKIMNINWLRQELEILGGVDGGN